MFSILCYNGHCTTYSPHTRMSRGSLEGLKVKIPQGVQHPCSVTWDVTLHPLENSLHELNALLCKSVMGRRCAKVLQCGPLMVQLLISSNCKYVPMLLLPFLGCGWSGVRRGSGCSWAVPCPPSARVLSPLSLSASCYNLTTCSRVVFRSRSEESATFLLVCI